MTRAQNIIQIFEMLNYVDVPLTQHGDMLTYQTQIGDGNYIFYAELDKSVGALGVYFKREGLYSRGEGVPASPKELIRALSIMTSIIHKIMRSTKVYHLYFSANQLEYKRVAIYDRIAAMLAKKYNGKVEKDVLRGEVWYDIFF